MAETIDLEPLPCPGCGVVYDMATGPCRPRCGNVCVCNNCGIVMKFDESLRLQVMPAEEVAKLPKNIRDAIRHFKNTKLLN